MIVTVRRWTSLALPRLKARSKSNISKVTGQNEAREKQTSFLDTYSKMFEYQVNLMFKDDLKN